MMNTQAKTVVLAQSVNRTRQQDEKTARGGEPRRSHAACRIRSTPTRPRSGSPSLTGAATIPQTTTQAIGAVPHAPRARWRRRDWLLVGGAALVGLIVAGIVARKRD